MIQSKLLKSGYILRFSQSKLKLPYVSSLMCLMFMTSSSISTLTATSGQTVPKSNKTLFIVYWQLSESRWYILTLRFNRDQSRKRKESQIDNYSIPTISRTPGSSYPWSKYGKASGATSCIVAILEVEKYFTQDALCYCNCFLHMICMHIRSVQDFSGARPRPYTLSDNTITQNYLAFSRITGNSKQDFTFTKKFKFEFTRT